MNRRNFLLASGAAFAARPFFAHAAGGPSWSGPAIVRKAYLAPGWRAGWLAVGRSPRLDDALGAIRKMADGRLCSPGPMQYAITAALTGDRSHQPAFVTALRARAAPSRTRHEPVTHP